MMQIFQKQILDAQAKYQTVGPFYLSDYFSVNGNNNLYNFLKNSYRPFYESDFRILIVQDCEDRYDYDDMPGLAICELQKHVSQIDISNSFILIITGNKNIGNELAQAQKLYSTDVWPMQSLVVEGVEYHKQINTHDTFCVLPWIHLYIGTNGDVLPCCLGDQKFAMGNVMDQPIENIMQSASYNTLRHNMLIGRRSKQCSMCYDQEDSGLSSDRMAHNLRWSDVKREDLNQSGKISKFAARYLDIRLNNICNLKCRMCSGYFSSAIAQEESELFKDSKSVNLSLKSKQRHANLETVLELLPYVEKIYFAGGEPLLAEEHYEILHRLIECGNTNIEITYNTNFTTLRYKEIDVLTLWKQFSNISIGASLDARDQVAEYVRHGSSWQEIESNLEQLKQRCPNVNFRVTSVVSMYNISSLIRLQKTWHEQNRLSIRNFSQRILTTPVHLSVTCLPTEHKKRIEDLIKEHADWCNVNGADKLAQQWQNVLTYMWSKDDRDCLDEFRRLTQIIDQHRKVCLSESIPELQDLL